MPTLSPPIYLALHIDDSCTMTPRDRALELLQLTTELLDGHHELLGEPASREIADIYERVRSLLNSLGQEAPGPQLAAVIAEAQEVDLLLWNALVTLEGRLSEAEAELAELRQKQGRSEAELAELRQKQGRSEEELAELRQKQGRSEAELAELQQKQGRSEEELADLKVEVAGRRVDHKKLVLREMGSQTENKLARVAKPNTTPKAACHLKFKRLVGSNDPGINKAEVQRVVQEYPGLEDGLKVLKGLGTGIAHPTLVNMGAGGPQPVTSALLQELIDEEFIDDGVKADVQAVFMCLTDLAEDLKEDLFVKTT